MAIVAEADTTQVSQAQFEVQDEAQPGTGVNVQGEYCGIPVACICVFYDFTILLFMKYDTICYSNFNYSK